MLNTTLGDVPEQARQASIKAQADFIEKFVKGDEPTGLKEFSGLQTRHTVDESTVALSFANLDKEIDIVLRKRKGME